MHLAMRQRPNGIGNDWINHAARTDIALHVNSRWSGLRLKFKPSSPMPVFTLTVTIPATHPELCAITGDPIAPMTRSEAHKGHCTTPNLELTLPYESRILGH